MIPSSPKIRHMNPSDWDKLRGRKFVVQEKIMKDAVGTEIEVGDVAVFTERYGNQQMLGVVTEVFDIELRLMQLDLEGNLLGIGVTYPSNVYIITTGTLGLSDEFSAAVDKVHDTL